MYMERSRRRSRKEQQSRNSYDEEEYDADLIEDRQPEPSCSSLPLLCIVVGLYAMVFGACAEAVFIAAKVEGYFRASWWWATLPLFGAEAALVIAQLSALLTGLLVFRRYVSRIPSKYYRPLYNFCQSLVNAINSI